MRKKCFFVAIMVITILSIAVSCVKDLDEIGFSNTTEYTGTVVEKSTMRPIEGVLVQVTNGEHVYVSTETDNQGKFVLKDIDFKEINEDSYLLLDGSALGLPSAKETLRGLGYKTYDYKTLILYENTIYASLPTFSYNGHTYRVAPATSDRLSWSNANTYCKNLSFGGYTDWEMPTLEELLKMYIDRNSIGGFITTGNHTEYWSSTADSTIILGAYRYYFVYFSNGIWDCMGDTPEDDRFHYYVRPIRMEE